VSLRRRDVELTVERPLAPGPEGGSVRLSARFETSGEEGPTARELSEALDRLRADLDALVGPLLAAAGAMRPNRELAELVSAYRPRQRELVDLLRDEGEITSSEHARLVEYLAVAPAAPRAEPTERLPTEDQPIAAAPILAERAPETARPVAELLRTFRIESLKQAGAVRARRQISFSEYMALKRHFESSGSEERVASPPP
jgi:hypothetical protein